MLINSDQLKWFFPRIDHLDQIPSISSSSLLPTTSSLYSLSNSSLYSSCESLLPSTTLTYEELLKYKTLPCILGYNCQYCPRTTVTNNQYYDYELKCHGYHHAKDQRRFPVEDPITFRGEFAYQANYNRDVENHAGKEKYSQNFFESLYHPLYYKQFCCKREYCNTSKHCPFYHTQDEKSQWELIFQQKFKVNRKSFLKTKSKQQDRSQISTPKSKLANKTHMNLIPSPVGELPMSPSMSFVPNSIDKANTAATAAAGIISTRGEKKKNQQQQQRKRQDQSFLMENPMQKLAFIGSFERSKPLCQLPNGDDFSGMNV